MAVTNGMVCPSSFDIDQVESAAKLQELVGPIIDLESVPHLQHLADAAVMNRYLRVPRIVMTTGVSLVMAKKFGIDLDVDEDGHKKICASIFALMFLEVDL